MFLHISADQILVLGPDDRILIPYQDLERILPPLLTTYIISKKPKQIVVLNGPGSFTTLRIGTLVINLLQAYHTTQIPCYQISKIDLYHLAYQANVLPQEMLIYLGQKKQCRKTDLSTKLSQKIGYTDAPLGIMKDRLAEPQRFFGDEITDHEMIHRGYDVQGLHLIGNQKKRLIEPKQLGWQPSTLLTPNYLVEVDLS